MNTFPGAPRLLRGAIVSFNLPDPRPTLIPFQFNPDTLTRTLEPQTAGAEGGDQLEALRLKGAPIETIKVDVELDASDALGDNETSAIQNGLYPMLSALETLVYPRVGLVIANALLLALGTIEILPSQGPFTLFVWGPKRVLPVRLTEFSITEEAYDTELNPIRAKVSLGLRVLSYNDLPSSHPGYHLFLAHQVVKETLATRGVVSSLNDAGVGNVKLHV